MNDDPDLIDGTGADPDLNDDPDLYDDPDLNENPDVKDDPERLPEQESLITKITKIIAMVFMLSQQVQD